MPKTILFAGTFDPPSLGHIDIIERATSLGYDVVVGVVEAPYKRPSLFSSEERCELVAKAVAHIQTVEIASYSGLTVEFAKKRGIHALVRGLRAFSDFEMELQTALANRHMSGIETLFLMADPLLSHISSTLIREIGCCHGKLDGFLPRSILDEVHAKILKATKHS